MKIKKLFFALSLFTSVLLAGTLVPYSPDINKDKKKKKEEVNISKDFEISGKSVLKKSKKAALVKVALHFKSISKQMVLAGRGTDRSSASAYAILEGVSEETQKEIVAAFYKSVATKLKANGFELVEWEAVKKAPSFAKVQEKAIDKYWEGKDVGYINVVTAHDAPHNKQIGGNPGIWKAYAKLGKEIGANPVTLDVIIDFAQFNMDVKAGGYKTKTVRASASVSPKITLQSFSGATGYNNIFSNFTMVGKYGEGSIISLKKNLGFPGDYATKIESFNGKVPASMKKRLTFGTSLETGTFIMHVDAQKYKTAVLSALDKYTDYLILKMKEVRK
jgi:hypothetical protein